MEILFFLRSSRWLQFLISIHWNFFEFFSLILFWRMTKRWKLSVRTDFYFTPATAADKRWRNFWRRLTKHEGTMQKWSDCPHKVTISGQFSTFASSPEHLLQLPLVPCFMTNCKVCIYLFILLISAILFGFPSHKKRLYSLIVPGRRSFCVLCKGLMAHLANPFKRRMEHNTPAAGSDRLWKWKRLQAPNLLPLSPNCHKCSHLNVWLTPSNQLYSATSRSINIQ